MPNLNYSTGTINVTQGTDIVIGNGVVWNGNVIAGYVLVTEDTNVFSIKNLVNTNQIQLDRPYPFATANGLRYFVFPTHAVLGDVLTAIAQLQTSTSDLANAEIPNSKLVQMAAKTFKGNNLDAAGRPLDLTAAQAKTMLNMQIADVAGLQAALTAISNGTGSGGSTGPGFPGGGNAGQFLKKTGPNNYEMEWSALPQDLIGFFKGAVSVQAATVELQDGLALAVNGSTAQLKNTGIQVGKRNTLTDTTYSPEARRLVFNGKSLTVSNETDANGFPVTVVTAGASLPTGGAVHQFLGKNSSADQDASWQDIHEVPAGGNTRQAFLKNSATNYDHSWLDIHEVPGLGRSNQVLRKRTDTSWDLNWTDIHELPSGGLKDQVLYKKSDDDWDVEWRYPNSAYRIGMYLPTSILANQVALAHCLTEPVTFKANFQFCRGKVTTTSFNDIVFNVLVNTTVIGTFTLKGSLNADGTFNSTNPGAVLFSTTGGAIQTAVAGDVVKIVQVTAVGSTGGNASQVYTMRDLAVTLVGNYNG